MPARFLALVIALLLSAASLHAQAPGAPATRPVPAVQHVVIISVDGLRPDVLLRGNAPNMRALADRGAFTYWARTTAMAVTLPSHTSMLTGLPPTRHGITWNDDRPYNEITAPAGSTLFQLAKQAGLTTAFFAGKSKFIALVKAGGVDVSFVPPDGEMTADADVARRAAEAIASRKPAVTFVHLPDMDSVGHAKGWGSDEQMAQLPRTDSAVGTVLESIKTAGLADSTVVILSSDHGGTGKIHGPDDVRSRTIPWIIAGPGIRRNYDLARIVPLQVDTEDTFATSCYLLGIALPTPADRLPLEGKPIRHAIEQGDLLSEKPAGR